MTIEIWTNTPCVDYPNYDKKQRDTGKVLSLIRQLLSVYGLWGSPVHRTPHAVITLTIHHDQQVRYINCNGCTCIHAHTYGRFETDLRLDITYAITKDIAS